MRVRITQFYIQATRQSKMESLSFNLTSASYFYCASIFREEANFITVLYNKNNIFDKDKEEFYFIYGDSFSTRPCKYLLGNNS